MQVSFMAEQSLCSDVYACEASQCPAEHIYRVHGISGTYVSSELVQST